MRSRFLPGLVLLTGLGLVSAGPVLADSEAQQIVQLQAQVRDLQQRVAKLERAQVKFDAEPAQVIRKKPRPGGWKDSYNWGLLLKGMDHSQVVERLGEPDQTLTIGKFETWNYGDGQVEFYLGRLRKYSAPTGK